MRVEKGNIRPVLRALRASLRTYISPEVESACDAVSVFIGAEGATSGALKLLLASSNDGGEPSDDDRPLFFNFDTSAICHPIY